MGTDIGKCDFSGALKFRVMLITKYGPVQKILVLVTSASSESFDEPAHICSLARAMASCIYSKTCVKWQLKNRQNKDLNDKW